MIVGLILTIVSLHGIIATSRIIKNVSLEFYEKVTAYKKKGIKVLVAIGGWNDSAGDKYSRLVNNPSARRRFIEHVVGFIEKNNFDGLDLDWEYPKCWQVSPVSLEVSPMPFLLSCL